MQVVSETNGLCRPAPACTRLRLVPGMQSPVRPRRSFLTVSLHVAIPDISPNSACHPALISVRQGSSMRATQEREQNNDESTVASALLFIVIFLLLFFFSKQSLPPQIYDDHQQTGGRSTAVKKQTRWESTCIFSSDCKCEQLRLGNHLCGLSEGVKMIGMGIVARLKSFQVWRF